MFVGIRQSISADSATNFLGVKIVDDKVEVVDNVAAGVVITPIDPATGLPDGETGVFKGGTGDSFTVALSVAPKAGETVTVHLTADPGLVLSADHFDFTAANWQTARTVTITAPNDTLLQGEHVAAVHIAATSTLTLNAGSLYAALNIHDLEVNVHDDNTGSVVVTQTGGSTDVIETGTTRDFAPFDDTFSVVLTKAPTSPVLIHVNPAQTVTGGTLNQSFAYGSGVPRLHAHEPADPDRLGEGRYPDPRPQRVHARRPDDHAARLGLGRAAAVQRLDRAGLVPLQVRPRHRQRLGLGQRRPGQHVGLTLTFDASNWNIPQVVTVRAGDDGIINGHEYKVFAPQARTLAGILGPLTVDGGDSPNAPGAIPDPVLYVGETNPHTFVPPSNPNFLTNESEQVDTLNVLNTDGVADATGTLTDSRITGLGMGPDRIIAGKPFPGGITYANVEDLRVDLGNGNNKFVAQTTGGGLTTINGGDGNDAISLQAAGGPVEINGGPGDDTISLGSAFSAGTLGQSDRPRRQPARRRPEPAERPDPHRRRHGPRHPEPRRLGRPARQRLHASPAPRSTA